MEDVARTLPGWVERKNGRIHQATFMVPKAVFDEVERPALGPVVPSVYESAPLSLVSQRIGSMPYLGYKACKYSLPQDCAYTTVYYRAVGDKLHVYDERRAHVCTHDVSAVKGRKVVKPEHAREPSGQWRLIAERMRAKYNCLEFQHLINGFKKENGERHLAKQLGAVERLLDSERPTAALVAEVFAACCRDFRYRFSQFEQVYRECAARHAAAGAAPRIPVSGVQQRSLQSYQAEFERRCAS